MSSQYTMYNSWIGGEKQKLNGNGNHSAEPKIIFKNGDGNEVIKFTPDGIHYNHKIFPNNTYKQAGQRFFYTMIYYNHLDVSKRDVRFGLTEWKDHKKREIIFTKNGLEHNYDYIENWTWWMIDTFNQHIKRFCK